MNKTPIFYSNKQLEEIQKFIEQNFGKKSDYVFHELQSDYVHSDVMFIDNDVDGCAFATFGMGAGKMNSINGTTRVELVMYTNQKMNITDKKTLEIANQLVSITKYPFREDTWLGAGHTIDVSNEFKNTFGYDFLAFCDMGISVNLSGIDEPIKFLTLVPIYASEREWCVKNNTNALIDKLYEKYGDDIFNIDFSRDELLPDIDEDEIEDYNIMTILGINKDTYIKLGEYLSEQEENGNEITYEMIGKWIAENK